MARNLYRFYLYTIFIALVVFAANATGQLLNTLLDLTSLRDQFVPVPTQAMIVQSLVFAIVGWIVAGTLGGLHYWLIRRDMRSDPEAGISAIRAFFLNGTELIGAITVALTMGFAFNSWAYNSASSLAGSIAGSLPTLAMVLLLELERRRTSGQKGLALTFQRLHFFGAQLFLLSFLLVSFLNLLRPFVAGLFFSGKGSPLACTDPGCAPNLVGLGVTLLWFLLCWLVYCLATRQDSSRNVRMLMHGLGLGLGVISVLFGAFLAFEVLLSPLFQIKLDLTNVLGGGAQFDFVSPLFTGLLVALVYHLLLRNLSQRGLTTPQVRLWTEGAIVAALMGGTFWIGCGYGLYNFFESLSHISGTPDQHDWVTTIALIVAGVGYIGLDFLLQRASRLDPDNAVGPRRGFVLALLGGGILSFAGGGATALYAWGTALLGSPIANWVQIAHAGLAGCLIGAVVLGIYLWATLRGHLIGLPAKASQPTQPDPTASQSTALTEPLAQPVPPAAAPASLTEEILDELLANRISREEAVRRLRELQNTPVPL